jgi:hypothetical protein
MISQMKKAVVVLLALGGAALASTDGWQLFNSSTGFSVSYPANWFKVGISKDRLQLRSSEGGAEGVGIKHGQAEIIVMEAEDSSSQTLAQVIAYYTQDTTVLSHRTVPAEASNDGCSEIQEITSKEPAVPPTDSPISVPNIVNTDFFCEDHGRKITTLLRNWEGDKLQEGYQQVALQMAKSIRLSE